jgi:hypothetical protein
VLRYGWVACRIAYFDFLSIMVETRPFDYGIRSISLAIMLQRARKIEKTDRSLIDYNLGY